MDHILELGIAFLVGLCVGLTYMGRAWKRYHERAMAEAKKFHDEEVDVAEQTGWYGALEDQDAVWKAFHKLYG